MSAGKNIIVIGGEDAVFGLSLVGLAGRVVSDIDEARKAIQEAAADPDIALILLTEDWSAARPEASPDAVDQPGALIVEIPSPGPAAPSIALKARIEQALGVRLEH